MSQLISISRRLRQRHGPNRRWSSEEKAWYVAAVPRTDLSGVAFCREMGVPLARVAFACVEVVAAVATVPMNEPPASMRLVVRGVAGHEAALDGVDAATVVRPVALVLGRER